MLFSTSLLKAGLFAGIASAATKYAPKTAPLDTPWTDKVGTDPWPEYPRPQLERHQWQSLNGIWTYSNASSVNAVNTPPFKQELDHEVLIPSCLESGLSGIMGDYMLYSWFSTSFQVPSDWTSDNVLLNFGAIDYEATVFVNGQKAGFHRGGYFAFTVDVTQFLTTGDNELLVFVHDPTDLDPYVIPIGKQTLRPSHIFYTPCSGIWQSVWIESAPANHITQFDIAAGADGKINATVETSQGKGGDVTVSVMERDSKKVIATHKASADAAFTFSVDSPKLWAPGSPNLYDISVTMGNDKVSSYTGFRTVSRGVINGIERPLLNGEFLFYFGTLDQGYWPDGLYTPPNRDAMVYDLEVLQKLNYNMLRKHIKVESALFYQACDEMGLMVIQDMPSLRPIQSRTLDNCTVETILPDPEQQAEFTRQLEVLIKQQRNYPSIVAWVIYNEGWGQITDEPYPEFPLTDLVRSLDPTRLIDSTTGWVDHGAGDFSDNHHYANPQCGTPFYSIASIPYDPSRIAIQGEFGGIGQNVSIEHLWNVQEAIDHINQTYEIDETIEAWRYRGHRLLGELEDQVEMWACSGGIWTQTTDVEGEVNGMLTYDRRILRPDVAQWSADLQALYDAAARRAGNGTMPISTGMTSYGSVPATTPPSYTSSSMMGGESSMPASTTPMMYSSSSMEGSSMPASSSPMMYSSSSMGEESSMPASTTPAMYSSSSMEESSMPASTTPPAYTSSSMEVSTPVATTTAEGSKPWGYHHGPDSWSYHHGKPTEWNHHTESEGAWPSHY